uniref:Uncharacterized protein n=1 Tax=Eutreptiella gymnastica TaxID=73025 RepID=A0A6T2G4V3_9EUGL|mmetsp:Transcript_4420/g.7102  ORF Transcript_4420/g.7102 Transcript_4420/m.7102 type:complete len:134 (-) Transcript_4420:131-532(-)|eukprot:CAMPEP_0174361680 /NCGR_PEP_ID=MMETSP0811_2-20130205/60387_1 /TAXON_ID=73025 ORGANISM="Eutreptiella gymnastica-like, Strain CCMP1594" /NCGR_SAMPLE_ID=MMETSP0811_2 /ASSEMBLY_ACC=CAM_ASM_000667 /LENGTH=133 /DNA_ID=CAMNT_0015498533 /DNA_START=182 /DNA_END=583 /DNA_ORIENTATION=+
MLFVCASAFYRVSRPSYITGLSQNQLKWANRCEKLQTVPPLVPHQQLLTVWRQNSGISPPMDDGKNEALAEKLGPNAMSSLQGVDTSAVSGRWKPSDPISADSQSLLQGTWQKSSQTMVSAGAPPSLIQGTLE